jgi:hypothetical protein
LRLPRKLFRRWRSFLAVGFLAQSDRQRLAKDGYDGRSAFRLIVGDRDWESARFQGFHREIGLAVINLPQFALPFFYERVRCKACGERCAESDLTVAGAMRDVDGTICFGYEVECPRCKKTTTIIDTTRPFTLPDWWAFIKRGRRTCIRNQSISSPPARGSGPQVEKAGSEMDKLNEVRPEFYAYRATLMDCIPGNLQHAEGEECLVVTIGKTGRCPSSRSSSRSSNSTFLNGCSRSSP